MLALQQLKIDFARRVTSRPPKETFLDEQSSQESRRVKAEPKTEFGKRMLKLRRAIEDSDVELLTLEEISEEVRDRRGERY